MLLLPFTAFVDQKFDRVRDENVYNFTGFSQLLGPFFRTLGEITGEIKTKPCAIKYQLRTIRFQKVTRVEMVRALRLQGMFKKHHVVFQN